MYKIFCTLACLTCVGHGRRLQSSVEGWQRSRSDNDRIPVESLDTGRGTPINPLQALATLFLASSPTAAFNLASPGMRAPLATVGRHPSASMGAVITKPQREKNTGKDKAARGKVKGEEKVVGKGFGYSTKEAKKVAKSIDLTKAAKQLEKAMAIEVEKRVDPADNNCYTEQEFKDFYGEKYLTKWNKAKPPSEHRRPLEEVKIGEEIEGKVTNVQKWGVFFDFGCTKDALLHHKDNHAQVKNYAVGDVVRGIVKELDAKQQRVSVRSGEPKKSAQELTIGQEVTGKVMSFAKFGVFLDIGTPNVALLHNSQIPGSLSDPRDRYQLGDTITAFVVKVDGEQVTLSMLEEGSRLAAGERNSRTAADTSRAVEKRIDPNDGNSYTQQGFKDFYGDVWQQQWDSAKLLTTA